MTYNIQYKIQNTKNYYKYLKENSNWIKLLNRNEKNIDSFINFCKEKYKLSLINKVENIKDNIDIVKNVLSILK